MTSLKTKKEVIKEFYSIYKELQDYFGDLLPLADRVALKIVEIFGTDRQRCIVACDEFSVMLKERIRFEEIKEGEEYDWGYCCPADF